MRFRSPLLSQSRFLSFPPGTEMVHFPGFARTRLWIHRAVRGFCPRGFPHSEIPGSKPACGSPRLIAACHVLHRRLLPRHPPCALSSLTTKFTRCTCADRCSSFAVRGLGSGKAQTRRVNSWRQPAHRTLIRSLGSRTPAGNNGTHKNLLRLVICPIYSVVKVRPRCQTGQAPSLQPTRLSGFGLFPTQCSASKQLSLDRELIHGC
jgi:hypothetical protein